MPIARLSLVVTILLVGAAVLVTSWTTMSSVRNASQALERGQADGIRHTIRGALNELGRMPTDEDLGAIVTAGAADGLGFLAVLDPTAGRSAHAGTPVGWAPELGTGSLPQGRVVDVGRDRLRVTFHTLLRRERGAGGVAGLRVPRLEVAFEFLPKKAQSLRAIATRAFFVGAVAAFTLAALALALLRWVLKREAMACDLERARRMVSLGELSAVLAHEIRNPLASLKGNAQLLASSLPRGEPARSSVDRVVEDAVHLENLVNDLLEFARTGQLERLPRNPAAVLTEAVEAAASGHVVVDVARAPTSWSLDGERMVQALTNLLEHAMQAGGSVRASAAVIDAQLVFEVRDTGPGVPHADKQRVFEPFFTQQIRGTGLGLAVTRRIVEMHGGHVSVTDGAAGGPVFRITLPPG